MSSCGLGMFEGQGWVKKKKGGRGALAVFGRAPVNSKSRYIYSELEDHT